MNTESKISDLSRLSGSTTSFGKMDINELKIEYSGVDKLFDTKVDNIPEYFYIGGSI